MKKCFINIINAINVKLNQYGVLDLIAFNVIILIFVKVFFFILACFDLNLETNFHDLSHDYNFHEFPVLADGLPAHKDLKYI